ncbi:DUF4439 domain-containing protein [Auraticoccus monumenti]|uniref:DUF4439 domain-containing protein n=1 Tax=Auraticoccus monumenti TaxID=675864 RepID=A0A1G7DAW2_9ACTN|nr:DUF4439 domain-containing protein [Auraticoccus monumenti]SDE48056.1 protein of unknown function [Auraticoccus monumenti]
MLPVTRRDLLAALAGVAVLPLAACAQGSPVVRGGPTAPPPRPTAPVVPGAPEGADREDVLAALARGRGRGEEGGDADRWVTLAEVHAEHALVLRRPDPTVPPPGAGPSPTPAPVPAPPEGARWEEEAATAAEEHRRSAAAASGDLALLWASLAAFAAAAPRAAVLAPAAPPPLTAAPSDDLAAMGDLVTALHQAVFGYELALVPLAGGGEQDAVRSRLEQLLGTRDRVGAVLAARGRAVPTAATGYDVEVPGDEAASRRLRRAVEGGLLPWSGGWVRASGDRERPAAVAALVSGTVTAAALGSELGAWPGW